MKHCIEVKATANPNPNYVPPSRYNQKSIFTLMVEDNWFGGVQPVAFFSTREKAEAYEKEAQKDKKRWKHCRFFIQEYMLDTDYNFFK